MNESITGRPVLILVLLAQISFSACKKLEIKREAVVSADEISLIGYTNCMVKASIIDQGEDEILNHGICWSETPEPTILDDLIQLPGSPENFSIELTGLETDTRYYVKAFISNRNETFYSQKSLPFTTLSLDIPTVITRDITDITPSTANLGGAVTETGGLSIVRYGVCWSTSPTPDMDGPYTADSINHTGFAIPVRGLTPDTKYYVRAFAANSIVLNYGNEKEFTTAKIINLPSVTTNPVTNVKQNSAESGGNVTSDGNSHVTDRGICWSMSAAPDTSDFIVSGGEGTGGFKCTLSGLNPGTEYFVRAYAINEAGVAYGNQINYTHNP